MVMINITYLNTINSVDITRKKNDHSRVGSESRNNISLWILLSEVNKCTIILRHVLRGSTATHHAIYIIIYELINHKRWCGKQEI